MIQEFYKIKQFDQSHKILNHEDHTDRSSKRINFYTKTNEDNGLSHKTKFRIISSYHTKETEKSQSSKSLEKSTFESSNEIGDQLFTEIKSQTKINFKFTDMLVYKL